MTGAEEKSVNAQRLLGGEICLDFANTLERRYGTPMDRLSDYTDLLHWCKHTHLIGPDAVRKLTGKANQNTEEANHVFNEAILLREAIYRTFRDIAHQTEPQHEDVALIVANFTKAVQDAQLVKTEQVFDWENKPHSLASVLYPIAHSAIQLLREERLQRVRECEGDGCGWLFVDTTRNHSRRWCSLDSCGNRMRMRKSRARQQIMNEPD